MRTSELARRLAREIAAGRWSGGVPLPGVRVLAQEVGCSAGTVAGAYRALRDGGVLTGSPRTRFSVVADGAARAAGWRVEGIAMRVAGSDDPALDVLARCRGRAAAFMALSDCHAEPRTLLPYTFSTRPAGAGTIRWRAERFPESESCWCICGAANKASCWRPETR